MEVADRKKMLTDALPFWTQKDESGIKQPSSSDFNTPIETYHCVSLEMIKMEDEQKTFNHVHREAISVLE